MVWSVAMTKSKFLATVLWFCTGGVIALAVISVWFILQNNTLLNQIERLQADLASCQEQLPPQPAVSK